MGKRINILHIIDKFSMDGENPSSCTRLMAEWIIRHDSSLFNVMVAGLRRDSGSRILEDIGIKVYYIEKGKISPINVAEIIKLIKREKVDLVHLHGYASANFGRLAARKVGIPNIVHEHAILNVLPHQFLVDYLLKNKTDVAIAVAEAVKRFMIKGRSIPENRIKVVWNGIRIEKYQNVSRERIEKVKRAVGIQDGKKIVGTITRLRKEKGNAYFIEAAGQVCRSCPNVQFVIAGDGPLKEELMQCAQNLNLKHTTSFPGFVTDVPALLQAFDIVVMPSLTEGAPLALLEYMAAGRPIIATQVGGIGEVLKNNVSGILVPSADKNALANAITLLLNDKDKSINLAGNARKESKKFSIENNVRALEELYINLVTKYYNKTS